MILLDQIGSGSFGKVYKAKNKTTGQICAAKISIQKIEENSIDLIRNLSREVEIISRLNHPAILKFIFFCSKNYKGNPKPVIITEYAANGSLEDILEHDRNSPENSILTPTKKHIIIFGIASAMSYLHSYNIIHRDLKPANILLDENFYPKIANFGLLKISNKSTEFN